jgi:hypothetical protein
MLKMNSFLANEQADRDRLFSKLGLLKELTHLPSSVRCQKLAARRNKIYGNSK